MLQTIPFYKERSLANANLLSEISLDIFKIPKNTICLWYDKCSTWCIFNSMTISGSLCPVVTSGDLQAQIYLFYDILEFKIGKHAKESQS